MNTNRKVYKGHPLQEFMGIIVPLLSEELRGRLSREGTLEQFLDHYRSICQRSDETSKNRAYANCLHQLLEIAPRLHDLGREYVIVGGLVIPVHLYQTQPEHVINWRGTSDIDVLAQESEVADVLISLGYRRINGNTWSKHGARGTTKPLVSYVHDSAYHQLVQIREDVVIAGKKKTHQIYRDAGELSFYRIPVRVPSIADMIAMKRDANRGKDREDIRLLRALQRIAQPINSGR